jgi:Nuclease-related domain
MFDDGWTLLRGYRNVRGEIDGLLLGSRGLFAIECKHVPYTVHCRCDDWWGYKLDRWGNELRRGRLADDGGRSPSRQLNDAADELERFLERRREPLRIRRIVLFTHPRSACGTFTMPTVDLITTSKEDIAV